MSPAPHPWSAVRSRPSPPAARARYGSGAPASGSAHGLGQRRTLAYWAALVILAASAACGDGEDGTGADTARAPAECRPVGEELASRATERVEIELRDFSFSPSAVTVRAGIVTFAVRNVGSENHELAFLPGGRDVPMAKGEPDEGALEKAGAFELEAFGPGQTCTATYQLAPGTYTLFCVVTSADGRTHYDKGMRGQLLVR